jgi:hypothetical protein
LRRCPSLPTLSIAYGFKLTISRFYNYQAPKLVSSRMHRHYACREPRIVSLVAVAVLMFTNCVSVDVLLDLNSTGRID